MTQQALILDYLKKYDEMTPAKMSGQFWKGQIFGSEVSKRCRELRKSGKLQSRRNGKFEVFRVLNTLF